MNKEVVYLRLKLKLDGLDPRTEEITFCTAPLEEVDKMTFAYQDEQCFFEDNKSKIEQKLLLTFDKDQIPPTDIKLVSKGIYIRIGDPKEGEKKATLFGTVPIQGNRYDTLDVANKKLMQGRMYILYVADLMNQKKKKQDYRSIFTECRSSMMWKMENNKQITPNDLNDFWYHVQEQSYYYSVIRFILSNDMELRIITDVEKERKEKDDRPRQRDYWYPYKD